MGTFWEITRDEDDAVHVRPVADLVGHELAATCVCSPTPECVPTAAGPDGWVYVHHSLDGRELHEVV